MAVYRELPYTGNNFLVDLGAGETAGPKAGLLEVILPEARLEVIEYRNGNDKENAPRKTQTLARYSNLVLRRGATGLLDWYEWWSEVRDGSISLRNVAVLLMSEDQAGVVLTWKLYRARPVAYYCSPLNALGTEVLIETLEIAFEKMEME